MVAIRVNQLTKVYGNVTAVNHINMNVPVGAVYGFIGPNGAGKTTTIEMIMGLKKMTSGTIEIFGTPIDFYDSSYKQAIGYVSDVPEFYHYMSARELLSFSGQLFGLSKMTILERIPNILSLVGLEDNKKPIGTYSRGMRQRLGIAEALINDPKIIILDEPTSALDPIGRKEVMEIILKLKGEKTIFYSTHILSDVERVCDVVGIIHKGELILEEPMNQIKKNYIHTKFILETNQSFERMKDVFILEPWVLDFYFEKNESIIEVTEEGQAMTRIPQLIGENDWQLKKFVKVEQTLEDIFMKVVGKG